MQIVLVIAWIMLIALTAYVLLGGADFGGGIWDLLATVSRQKQMQRRRIRDAIGPIWEANHVWLIVVIVVMFTCFPPAFSAVMTALHVPVTLMLIGIVLRGSAFTFATYDRPGPAQDRWRRVFAWASAGTPLLLGVTLGAIASGQLHWTDDGVYVSGFFSPWLKVFPWCVGVFTMSICALLAAVYLYVETDEEARESFRKSAIGAQITVAVMAVLTWGAAWWGAPLIASRLSSGWLNWMCIALAVVCMIGVIANLRGRRPGQARAFAVAEVTFIVVGYGAAQFPYLVPPQFTVFNSAAAPRMLWLLLLSVLVGAVIVLPSLWYLFRVFKGQRAFTVIDRE